MQGRSQLHGDASSGNDVADSTGSLSWRPGLPRFRVSAWWALPSRRDWQRKPPKWTTELRLASKEQVCASGRVAVALVSLNLSPSILTLSKPLTYLRQRSCVANFATSQTKSTKTWYTRGVSALRAKIEIVWMSVSIANSWNSEIATASS